jgi:hypothetical protein
MAMIEINKYIECVFVKKIVEEETGFMENLFESNTPCEDEDPDYTQMGGFIDDFTYELFNNFKKGRFDIGADEGYMALFEKSRVLMEVMNYIKNHDETNYGECNADFSTVESVARYYAVIWGYESQHVLEKIYKTHFD